MAFFGSLPLDAMLLEACQPYYYYQPTHRHQAAQAPQERSAPPRSAAPAAPARAPALSASESADDFKLYIALPGLERRDIAISVDEGVLSLEAARPADPALDRFRQVPAKLRRTWKMPECVDASAIRAKLANGELVITLPKMAKAEPRQVVIGGDEDDAPALAAPPAAEPATAEPAAAEPNHKPAAHAEPEAHAAPAGPKAAAASLAEAVAGVGAAGQEAAAAAGSEADGSVEDLSDEEREAEAAARRRKALAPGAGPVLMATEEAPAQAA